MKKFLILFFAIQLCVSACNQKKDTDLKVENIEYVNIEYIRSVNGYLVKAIWKPLFVKYDYTRGPAIIEFYNLEDSLLFTITNDNFSILNSKLPFTYSENKQEIIMLNQKEIKLDYDTNYFNVNYLIQDEPFFFIDLNFDNTKELLIAEANMGQRYEFSYKAYKIENGEIPSYNITYNEPYMSLDGLSEIDYKNKSITIYGSGGGCANNASIYKIEKNEYSSTFYLETKYEQERDDILNKCYEVEYKLIGGCLQVVSKKEL